MKSRFTLYVTGLFFSWVVPQNLYAQQQECEALIAVSYVSPHFTAAQRLRQQQLNSELLKALAQGSAVNIKLEQVGSADVLTEARSGRVDLVVGVRAEPEPDPQLNYIAPAYLQTIYRLWVRTAEYTTVEKWPELRGLRGVHVAELEQMPDFDRQAQLQYWPLRKLASLEEATYQVIEGQADYILAEQQTMQKYLQAHDLLRRFEALEPPVVVKKRFLAIAKDSVCNTAAMRKRLSKALASAYSHG
ncbi:transporter substrate-binding domain-containing protein [Denitrificimonas sp. JX-1]|uniref:Transporter substrate-binding domain-containing protein n=1 Tax=Denitrificimonas halotolerans TaxID=3098930 RepID=A0ABU5GSL9_9GAMM|nr:transporter substrate-binding domain-containing protein [Denitrificimonas sp. JX-1]MDY7218638.1 transporter substrate-binding domain-containing protein [Denitrificimonas sp. JX-1]